MSEVQDLRIEISELTGEVHSRDAIIKGTEAELEDAETKITVLSDVLSMSRRANVAFQAREKEMRSFTDSATGRVSRLERMVSDRDEIIEKLKSKIAECEALARGDSPRANQL